MHSHAGHSAVLKFHLFLSAAALIAAGALMLVLARSGSLSGLRLILIGGTFLAGLLLAAAAIRLHLQPERNRALQKALFNGPLAGRLTPILAILFVLSWCLTWLPPGYTGNLYYYFLGFYPLFLCGSLASGSGLLLLLTGQGQPSGSLWSRYGRAHKAALYVALTALAAAALVAALSVRLGLLTSYEPFWYGAGVPILAWQVFLSLLIAVLALQLEGRSFLKRLPLDLLLFILIWMLAAGLWASQPVRASYWVTGPQAPNNEYYPFSDLAVFDIASQFALIGQGINNHVFFDRALYMSFLVYLHSLAGQNYQLLMAVQAALFAVFPALLFLIGRRLHSRTAGILLAALTILRGLNSLSAAAWIDTATFKHMLTDFPTAIGVALCVLLLLRWVESPHTRARSLLWIGAVLGLTSLLRPHVLLLVPLVVLLALWVYRARVRRALVLCGLTLLALLAAISPWLFLGPGAGSIFALYGQRIHDVMVQRYPQLVAAPALTPAPLPATALPSTLTQPTLVPASTPSAPAPHVPPPANPAIAFQLTQYLHNLVTSALIFPASPFFLSVKDTVKGGEGYWQVHWDGSMSTPAACMLILNLIIVALGLGAGFQHRRWSGLLPLTVLLIYFVANALARTSGGRYLVPVDWILVTYYALGLTEMLFLGTLLTTGAVPAIKQAVPITRAPDRPLSVGRALVVLGAAALMGGLIPLAGVIYPSRYAVKSPTAAVADIQPFYQDLGWTDARLSAFLAQPEAVVLYGRALYPRFYGAGAGEPVRYLPFRVADYPRTVFIFIGPMGQQYVILPGPAPKVLPNASDVIVLGCRSIQEGYDTVSAWAVILPQLSLSYARRQAASPACPPPAP
jgi:hypothetical protein